MPSYLVRKEAKDGEQQVGTRHDNGHCPSLTVLQYSEFTPLLLREHAGKITEEFPTLNKAMDLFYSKLESDKNVGSILPFFARG